MPWIDWKDTSFDQKLEVLKSRPGWSPFDYCKFAFFFKKDGHLSKAKGGGSHRITDAEAKRQIDELNGGSIYNAEKGDLHCWRPGHSFSFIRD